MKKILCSAETEPAAVRLVRLISDSALINRKLFNFCIELPQQWDGRRTCKPNWPNLESCLILSLPADRSLWLLHSIIFSRTESLLLSHSSPAINRCSASAQLSEYILDSLPRSIRLCSISYRSMNICFIYSVVSSFIRVNRTHSRTSASYLCTSTRLVFLESIFTFTWPLLSEREGVNFPMHSVPLTRAHTRDARVASIRSGGHLCIRSPLSRSASLSLPLDCSFSFSTSAVCFIATSLRLWNANY